MEKNKPNCVTHFGHRALEEKRARLGLVECVNHELLQPYPVLHEKPGDFVAHIKFTVLLMPNGSDRITSHPLQELQPTKTVDDPEVKAWLALPVKSKKKGGGKKKKEALQLVLSQCKPNVKIVDLCEKGDSYIREQTGSMYKNVKKKIERGVAFPTCLSVNNTVGHFSPLASDESVLKEGDILKIDMGCHIDGFIAVVAHTHVLQEGPVTGRAADVIAAANTAAEVALRLVRPGKKLFNVVFPHRSLLELNSFPILDGFFVRLWSYSDDAFNSHSYTDRESHLPFFRIYRNQDVTEAIQKVAAAYDCKIVEGVLSHQLKQFVIDGNKVVLSVANPDTRVDDAEFEENEVYAIDIVTSTGDGKPKLLDEKQTTIYKRAVDKNYHLKMKASRFIFSEISQKFPIMPFSARCVTGLCYK
ncbi:ERBB-3 BINDING PROTEIN 1 [Artemisia annua]|uniref:ERBB-3 BINDING PROTEIN 1 n=1 Tax=Artemisia annua TaxID=35608 RepID=A0A2U1P0N8_ARTAN|nr:ERBB-3 BINDING PROTEIN 1 [Artemisia annua]